MNKHYEKSKMALEDGVQAVLKYLREAGPTNTFRLARQLGVERGKVVCILRKLEEKEAVELKTGIAKFLKFPSEEKADRAEKALPKEKTRRITKRAAAKHKASATKKLHAENEMLRVRVSELETGYAAKSRQLRNQSDCIEKLETTVKALQQKAKARPKVITKTIVKKVIQKVPVKVKEAARQGTKPKGFMPKLNLKWLRSVQQLETPKFIEQKIRIGKPSVSLAELNRSLQQVRVPEILRKH